MGSKFLEKYRQMPMVARRMVRVFWLYFFFQLIADVFVSVHVIEQTRSLQSLVLFRWVYFFGAFLAFAVFGAFFPRLGLPMRWGYIGSFSLYLVSTFLLLIFPQELAYFLVFSFFQGLALGLFWMSVHAYELEYIDDKVRDFYSSIQQSGTLVLKVAIPIISAAFFFLARDVFQVQILTFLLIFLIILCLIALPIVSRISSFVPPNLSFADLRWIHRRGASRATKTYYLATSFKTESIIIAASLFALLALGNIVNIGIWEAFVGLVAISLTTFLAPIRTAKNRFIIMLFGLVGLSVGAFFLAFSGGDPIMYVLYSIVFTIFSPIVSVSSHTIHLACMESSGNGEKSKYAGMIYREWVLFVGRTFGTLILLSLSLLITQDILLAQLTIVMFIILSLVTIFSAKILTH